MKKLYLVLILILFVVQGQTAQAAPAVGTLTLKKGTVKLRRAGSDTIHREAEKEIPIQNLDEIQTGKNSQAIIKLTGKGASIELFSQSFFKIDKVGAEESLTSLPIGKAKFSVPKSLKKLKRGKRRFRVRTANALVGVKGTKFILATGVEETNLLTLEGTVTLASLAAPDVEVEVSQNQISQIRQNAPPTAPVTVPPKVRDNIISTDSPKAFQNVKFGNVITPSGKQESKKKEEKKEEKESAKKEEKKQGTQAEKKEESKAEGKKEQDTKDTKEEPKATASKEEPKAAESKDEPKEEGQSTAAPLPLSATSGESTAEQDEPVNTQEPESLETEEGLTEDIETDEAAFDLSELDETDLEEAEFEELEFEIPEIEDIIETVNEEVSIATEETADIIEEIEEIIEEVEEIVETATEIEIIITYE